MGKCFYFVEENSRSCGEQSQLYFSHYLVDIHHLKKALCGNFVTFSRSQQIKDKHTTKTKSK